MTDDFVDSRDSFFIPKSWFEVRPDHGVKIQPLSPLRYLRIGYLLCRHVSLPNADTASNVRRVDAFAEREICLGGIDGI